MALETGPSARRVVVALARTAALSDTQAGSISQHNTTFILHLCRLERAIKQVQEQTPDAAFKVHWLPYQLNPAAGEEPINKLQYYNDKFGPARVAQMMPAMTVSAAQHTHANIVWAQLWAPCRPFVHFPHTAVHLDC